VISHYENRFKTVLQLQHRQLIIDITIGSQIPNLISQFLINQQGFDVDFGEHGLRMAGSWAYCTWQTWANCAEIRGRFRPEADARWIAGGSPDREQHLVFLG